MIRASLRRLVCAAVAALWLALAPAIGAEPSTSLRDRALAREWEAVALELEGLAEVGAVERHLAGHAYLAVNRNDESLCQFLEVAGEVGHRAWLAWAEAIASEHPLEPIAHVFHGDALARRGRFEQAIGSFDRALDLAPTDPLARNAKAAALAGMSRWGEAVELLARARRDSPELSDLHASLGTLFVKQSMAPQGAIELFDRALELSDQFSLALNGRASARFGANQWDAAERDFTAAADQNPCALIATENLVVLAEARQQRLSARIALAMGDAPGTTTQRRLQPADADLAGLRSAHNRVMISGFAADVADITRPIAKGPLGKLGATGAAKLFRESQTRNLDVARQRFDQMVTDNYNAVKQNVARFPNGPAAQAHGVTSADQLTRSRFENPSASQPGGADLDASGQFVDLGDWPTQNWLSLGYELSSPTHTDGEGE